MGGSGSGKTNEFPNLIKQQVYIDKIYLYTKDLSEPKYEFLIKKREDAEIKHLNDQKAFIECSNVIDNAYEDIEEYNSTRKIKVLIVFDGMMTDIMINKNFQAVAKKMFIRSRKLNISLAFISQSYFHVSKDVRFNLLFIH